MNTRVLPSIVCPDDLINPDAVAQPIRDVLRERVRQDTKWGVQRHHMPVWSAILGEEYGEFCEAILNDIFPSELKPDVRAQIRVSRLAIRGELVQLAAVAVAIIEHIDELVTPPPGAEPGGECE